MTWRREWSERMTDVLWFSLRMCGFAIAASLSLFMVWLVVNIVWSVGCFLQRSLFTNP